MGNTGYRFLISFFGFTLTLILLVNLVLFSNTGFFGDLQNDGAVYFGFSSFMDSFKLFETILKNYNANGFWSINAFYSCLNDLLDASLFGFPSLFDKINNLDFTTMPKDLLQAFPSYSVNDITEFFEYFGDVFKWFADTFRNFFTYIVSFGDYFVLLYKVFLAPFRVLVYSLYLATFLIYWVFVVFAWVVMLMQGYITKPLPDPSNVTSSWQDVVDYWNSEWANIPTIV